MQKELLESLVALGLPGYAGMHQALGDMYPAADASTLGELLAEHAKPLLGATEGFRKLLVEGAQPKAIADGLAALANYGAKAYLFIPGIGKINGIQAGNYIEYTGNTLAGLLDPTGLVVEAAQGGTTKLGAEKAGTDSGWIPTAGCTIVDGAFVINNAPNNGGASKSTLTIGDFYKVDFKIDSISGCSVAVYLGNTSTGAKAAAGEYSFILLCTASSTLRIYVFDDAAAINNAVISNLSVRRVPGVCLTQPITANKPILNRDANGKYYWKKGASAAWLSGAPLFDGTVRDYYVGAAFAPDALDSGIRYLFIPAMGSGTALRPALYADALNFRIFDSDGTIHLDASVGVLTAGTSYVMSGRRIGNTIYPKLNGIAKTAVTRTGQAAITSTQSRIMSDSTGTTYPFQGSAYGFCAVQATVSEQDQIDFDNMLAYFAGVTMP